MPNQIKKIEVYETLLHRIQLHAEVTMDHEALGDLIKKICNWSYAHRRGEGLSDAERSKLIKAAFDRLLD